ncbi:MAG: endonuclease V [Actinomycetota bacterium]
MDRQGRQPDATPVRSDDEAVAEQQRLAALVELQPFPSLPVVACGVDVSYGPGPDDSAVAVAVVIDTGDFSVQDRATASGRVDTAYRAGMLSFRELPLLLEAVARLAEPPPLIVADGHGYAHPERFGLASHLGVVTGIATIGCAKAAFVGTHGAVGPDRGEWADIVDRGVVVGSAVRTRSRVKPVYVSPGHLVDVESARRLVLALCPRFRLPETTRLADQIGRQIIRDRSSPRGPGEPS